MASGSITIEVRPGQTMLRALRVLDLVVETLKLVPEWHEAERAELAAEALRLVRGLQRDLRSK